MFLDKNELFSIGESKIEPDANYSGTIGCQMAILDGYANDMKLFEAMLVSDAQEVKMGIDEAAAEDIDALQEASFKGFVDRIKAMWDRIKTKVMGAIHNFVAKLSAWMGKNGKAYYDKYAKEISGKDFSGLKVRYSAPTGLAGSKVTVDGAGIIASLRSQVSKPEPLEKEELEKLFLKSAIKGVNVSDETLKEFKSSFHKLCFAEENKEYQVVDPAKMLQFISTEDVLKRMQEMEKEQKTALSSFDKDIQKFAEENKRKKELDKDANVDTYNHDPKPEVGGHTYGREQASILIANMTKGMSALQPAIHKALNAVMNEYKFGVAQSRRVMSAMVVYSPKKSEKSEAEHEDFMQNGDAMEFTQEAVEAEVYSDLEALD